MEFYPIICIFYVHEFSKNLPPNKTYNFDVFLQIINFDLFHWYNIIQCVTCVPIKLFHIIFTQSFYSLKNVNSFNYKIEIWGMLQKSVA